MKQGTLYVPVTRQVRVHNLITEATLSELVAALGEAKVVELALAAHKQEVIANARATARQDL